MTQGSMNLVFDESMPRDIWDVIRSFLLEVPGVVLVQKTKGQSSDSQCEHILAAAYRHNQLLSNISCPLRLLDRIAVCTCVCVCALVR